MGDYGSTNVINDALADERKVMDAVRVLQQRTVQGRRVGGRAFELPLQSLPGQHLHVEAVLEEFLEHGRARQRPDRDRGEVLPFFWRRQNEQVSQLELRSLHQGGGNAERSLQCARVQRLAFGYPVEERPSAVGLKLD